MAIAGLGDMNIRLFQFFSLAVCLAALLTLGCWRASAELEVSAGINVKSAADFDKPLAGIGSWLQIQAYGRCWHPAVTAEWRPYCNGHWELTDCGWYWVSDEPWAWACYHYGAWISDSSYGWVWVPGVRWAPAWVTWRTGGGYVGWAPSAPPGTAVAPSSYVFVESRNFNNPIRPDNVIINNGAVIAAATQIDNPARQQRSVGGKMQTVFVNAGPSPAMVEKATGQKLSIVPVEKADEAAFRLAPEMLKQRAGTADGGPGTQGAPPFGLGMPYDRNLNGPGTSPQSASERSLHVPHSLTDQQIPNEGTYPQAPGERALHLPDGSLPAPSDSAAPAPTNSAPNPDHP
jgi:hypothetical protein